MAEIEACDWSGVCRAPDCKHPVDVVLKSSDGKRYGAHFENLFRFNGRAIVPHHESILYGRDTPVDESGYSIRLLLLFSHNTEHPELRTFDLDLVLDFRQTALKYENWPAVQACRSAILAIGKRSPTDALRVLRYKACQFDDEEIDDIARRTMKVSTQHAAAWLKNDSAVYMTWYQYKIKWERSMTEFRELLDAGSREYFFFSKSNLLWTAFRSEVETEEIPTLDGLQRAVKVVNHLNEGSWYGSLNRRLVNDLESVVKGFPVWRDVEG